MTVPTELKTVPNAVRQDAGKTAMELAVSARKRHNLRVLFVDDEKSIAELMRSELPRMGHTVTVCQTASQAIDAIKSNSFDAAIVDLRMPGGSGWDVVDFLKQHSPETEFVISTGHGSMDDAIRGIRLGAYDFLPKPVSLFEISGVLDRIGDKKALQNKAIALETRLERVEGRSDLVGMSPSMQRVQKLIEKIAPTDSAVLIQGETGTGKEMVARRIHEMSDRSDAPFVAVNCGAVSENLAESEFFGHRKGAFTGAETARTGLFEVADKGTLFLDELGELDKSMQVKLLRFLESGEVRRVGENEPIHVDVRIVCATNRELEQMVAEGTFREDLFFRVNTFEIHLPPLRERLDDIPMLARHLIARHMKRESVPAEILPPDTVRILQAHHWSGNVRELSNVLEHALILSDGKSIRPEDLPRSVLANRPAVPEPSGSPTIAISAGSPTTLRDMEAQMIRQVLDKHDGDKPKAARELGIALKTLYNRLNQLPIPPQGQRDAG